MASPQEATYCFLVEWYDSQASMSRKYQFYYHVLDNTIEMYDVKNRRTFLKRCAYPSVQLSDLYVGSQVTVYARQIKVLDYGDDFTRNKLSDSQSRTIVLVKPDAYGKLGMLVDMINQATFTISRMKMCKLTESQAQEFYGDQQFTQRAQALSNGVVVAMEVVGNGVQEQLSRMNKNNDGNGDMGEGVYTSSSERSADMETRFLFENPRIQSTARMSNSTVCLIKPHAVSAGYSGQVIDLLMRSGFTITALEMFSLDRQAAEEFLEVYRTVVPEYNAIVEHFTSGPSIALEVCFPPNAENGQNNNVVQALRELCGPSDPEIARHIRPNTLRAQFGQNKVKNAVHCTDLPEDGVLESEFFFSILQRSIQQQS
jgi:nucleoside-diphosphate kinase